jgi:hypothetical protein
MSAEQISRNVNAVIRQMQNGLKLKPIEMLYVLHESYKHIQKTSGVSVKGFELLSPESDKTLHPKLAPVKN